MNSVGGQLLQSLRFHFSASLSSVESANIEYQLKIPKNVIEKGLLSSLQLEAIAYASQAHCRHLSDKDYSRAGFLIGTCFSSIIKTKIVKIFFNTKEMELVWAKDEPSLVLFTRTICINVRKHCGFLFQTILNTMLNVIFVISEQTLKFML